MQGPTQDADVGTGVDGGVDDANISNLATTLGSSEMYR